jgi:transposase
LLAEMPELGTLGGRAAAALAGLAPWTRQSGQWKGKSFISGGRKMY